MTEETTAIFGEPPEGVPIPMLRIHASALRHNLNRFREQVNHDPEVLLAEYAQMQAAIAGLRDQLKVVLTEALERGE